MDTTAKYITAQSSISKVTYPHSASKKLQCRKVKFKKSDYFSEWSYLKIPITFWIALKNAHSSICKVTYPQSALPHNAFEKLNHRKVTSEKWNYFFAWSYPKVGLLFRPFRKIAKQRYELFRTSIHARKL